MPSHDAHTLLLVLKLGLIVVVIVINTITHQVFRSLYKPTTVTTEINIVTFRKIFLTPKKHMPTIKYRAKTFINQLAKLLYKVLWGPTPIRIVKWWCGTSTCWFHIRSFPFYGTNTELSQLSIFHIVIKCYDNILFLCSGIEFQSKVNNDTSTPWDRY